MLDVVGVVDVVNLVGVDSGFWQSEFSCETEASMTDAGGDRIICWVKWRTLSVE